MKYTIFAITVLLYGCATPAPGVFVNKIGDDSYKINYRHSINFSDTAIGLCSQRDYISNGFKNNIKYTSYMAAGVPAFMSSGYIEGDIECIGKFHDFYKFTNTGEDKKEDDKMAKVLIYNSSSSFNYRNNEGHIDISFNEKYIGELAMGYYFELAIKPGKYKVKSARTSIFTLRDEYYMEVKEGVNVFEATATFIGSTITESNEEPDKILAEYYNYISDGEDPKSLKNRSSFH